MRTLRILLQGIVLLLCITAVTHAGGFQLNEHGARAMAQGGAFAARAYDLSAIFFNPAGLSYQRGFKLMLGATLIKPGYTFYGPSNANSYSESAMNDMTFYPPNAYIGNTWTEGTLDGFAAGIGVTTPYGLGTKWDDNWVGRAVTREIELQTFYVMPTVSYRIQDWISVGVGMNIVFSNVTLKRAVANFEPVMNMELDGTGNTAYSWNAGIMLKPIDDISIGLTYRAETKIDFEGTATFNPPASLAHLFPGGDVTTSITPPATYFAGIAWYPMDNLELEFDYQGIQWSSYDKLEVKFARNAVNDPTVAQNDVSSAKDYEDTYILRFGGEYSFPMSSFKLRAGYFFDNNPVPDKSLEPLLPDSDRHGVNIGFGYDIMANLTVDAAYLHMFINDRQTTATSTSEGVNMDGIYTGSADLFALNLTYAF